MKLVNSFGGVWEIGPVELVDKVNAEGLESPYLPDELTEGSEPTEGDWAEYLILPVANGILNPETGEEEFCRPFWDGRLDEVTIGRAVFRDGAWRFDVDAAKRPAFPAASAISTELVFTETRREIVDLRSALTVEGLKLSDVDLLMHWIESHGVKILTRRAYVTTGRVMNREFRLTGNVAYADDLNIVSVRLTDLDSFAPLVTVRFEIGARWMDDILDNNARRQRRIRPRGATRAST